MHARIVSIRRPTPVSVYSMMAYQTRTMYATSYSIWQMKKRHYCRYGKNVAYCMSSVWTCNCSIAIRNRPKHGWQSRKYVTINLTIYYHNNKLLKAFLANDDLGDSLDSVESLIKKHEDFEKSLAAQEEKIKALDEFATKLIEGQHYAADDVARRRHSVNDMLFNWHVIFIC